MPCYLHLPSSDGRLPEHAQLANFLATSTIYQIRLHADRTKEPGDGHRFTDDACNRPLSAGGFLEAAGMQMNDCPRRHDDT